MWVARRANFFSAVSFPLKLSPFLFLNYRMSVTVLNSLSRAGLKAGLNLGKMGRIGGWADGWMGAELCCIGRSSLSGLHVWVAEVVCCKYRLQRCVLKWRVVVKWVTCKGCRSELQRMSIGE